MDTRNLEFEDFCGPHLNDIMADIAEIHDSVAIDFFNLLNKNPSFSELIYYFNANGRFLEFQKGKTSAVLFKHFDEARLAIAAVRELFLANIDNPQDRRTVSDLLNNGKIEEVYHLKMRLEFP